MFDWLTPGVGSALGGIFGYKGQKDTNVASAQQAEKQMDFQKQMSNTAVQRRMKDLKLAGINPILAGSKEASSPAGAMAPVGNKAQASMQMAMNTATASALQSDAIKKKAEAIPYQLILDGYKAAKTPEAKSLVDTAAELMFRGIVPITDKSSSAEIERSARMTNERSLIQNLTPSNILRRVIRAGTQYFKN